MTRPTYEYVTLMASLPALKAPFVARQLPISRLRLTARLKMLEASDADMLQRIESIMEWERIEVEREDAAVLQEIQALMERLDSATLQRLLRDRFELRSVMAAMRRRRRGERAPATGAPWGYGRYVEQIRRNWNRPHFGLRRQLPWLAELRELHDSGSALELERSLIRLNWQSLMPAGRFHEFDFVAVVVYVLRYQLVARWLGYASDVARERFDQLVRTGLGSHGDLAAGYA